MQDAKPRFTSAGYVTKAALDAKLRKVAADTRRAGETDEQAYSRVLRESPALYDAYLEAN